MTGELDEFIDDDWEEERASSSDEGYLLDAFLFRFGSRTYAVRAIQVSGVIPWRTPVPLPRCDPRVGGVIQDRGRIVILMTHPTGEPRTDANAETVRVLVCATDRGYIGLPASATLRVGTVRLASEPKPLATVDSEEGVLTFLDPSQYVAR